MKLIYDLPTRLFHWLFALLFVFAFSIANLVDDDSSTFSFHMLAGLTMAFLVCWRVIWGIVGTKYARFKEFHLNPRELLAYFGGILSSRQQSTAGHNPASSWAALFMMACALGLAISGYLMGSGSESEMAEELHELLAYSFLVFVILHIAGVLLHSLKCRDSLWKSMLSGQKSGLPEDQSSVNPQALMASVFLIATLLFGLSLYRNFEPKTRRLYFFGTTLTLAEHEKHESGHHKKERNKSASRDLQS